MMKVFNKMCLFGKKKELLDGEERRSKAIMVTRRWKAAGAQLVHFSSPHDVIWKV